MRLLLLRVVLLLLLCAAAAWAWTGAGGFSDAAAPRTVFIPGAGCIGSTATSNWDLPTATPAVASCATLTNTQKGTLDFADTSGGFSAQETLALPANWTTARLPDVTLYWLTTTTSGNVKFTVQFVCTDVAATATDDPAFPTAGNAGNNVVTVATPGTGSRVQTSTIAAATLPTSCVTATRQLLHIRIFRDGADAADTATGATVRLVGLELTYYVQE